MMSLELYNDTCRRCSRLITTRYSTSFSLGIRSLHRSLREPIYSIYGFVRIADEIVDTFHEHDKAALFREFEDDAWKAISEGISSNPVLQSFQLVVNSYRIDNDLVRAFLRSMEMDLTMSGYSDGQYNEYIYGSAEVVGLMCLKVFCDGDESRYSELLPFARRLGAAFQKINFLRDIKSDFHDRGRVYFPGVDFSDFTPDEKTNIERDIAEDFKMALKGIIMLDRKSRFGVYLAFRYYVALFDKIKRASPSDILLKRFRVSDARKALLFLGAWIRNFFGVI
jgi:phytoene/squalene synthetase